MSAFEEIELDGMYEIELTDPQSAFFLGEEKYKLFVGGFGSGKSFTMALCAVSDLVNFPGANIGVYAPTFDLLSLIAMPYIVSLLEDGGYEYKINNQKHIISVVGYGNIIFRSMDNPMSIVGYEVFRSHCDEMDTMPAKKAKAAWEKIIARNRQKIFILDEDGAKIPVLDEDGKQKRKQKVLQWLEEKNGVNAYTTPEGFRFCYNRWVKDKKENDGYAIYKVSSLSNPHLPDDYIDSLKSTYSAELIDAYINGEFTNLTSGRVYRKYNRMLNESGEEVIGNETIHVGMDFNIEHGAAVIHVQRKNGDHAVDEITDSYDTDDTIRILKERYPDNQIYVYPDASGVKRSSGGSNGVDTKGAATATDIAKLKRAGFHIIVNSKNPLIKDRVASVCARICNGFDERKYFVNVDKCPNVAQTLEQQIYKNGVPDKTEGLDHVGDCIGYYIVKVHPIERLRAGYIKTGKR
jgi:hypothetical protein